MIGPLGLAVEENGDSGDCPCRTGVVIGFLKASGQHLACADMIQATQKHLMPLPNTYWRYPTTYNQTDDFSRDQASRLMLGYGIAGRKDLVKGYYLTHNFRHQNGDLLGTGEPGNIIRSLDLWYLGPLLWLFDIKFLYDVLVGVHLQTDYDNLFVFDLWFAKNYFWTPWAWLAGKLYNKEKAAMRIKANLLSTERNGCAEAGNADLWFLDRI